MAIYGISDLHLAKDIDKPMDVFGNSWDHYMERIEANWDSTIGSADTVLVPGDISWATYVSEIDKDFAFIEERPGRKLMSRGNHDYWWSTLRKLEIYITNKEFNSISFIQNKATLVEEEGAIISGTRGWMLPSDADFGEADQKIFDRELARLDLCIADMRRLDPEHKYKWILMMHYPPMIRTSPKTAFVGKITEAGIDLCVYGHLHGLGHRLIVENTVDRTEFRCISADFLRFMPQKLIENGEICPKQVYMTPSEADSEADATTEVNPTEDSASDPIEQDFPSDGTDA